MGSCCSSNGGGVDSYQLQKAKQKRKKNAKTQDGSGGPRWVAKRRNANKYYTSVNIKINKVVVTSQGQGEGQGQEQESMFLHGTTLPSTVDYNDLKWFGTMRGLEKSEVMEEDEGCLMEGPILGRGSFGEVRLVRNRKNKYFAMKRIEKSTSLKDKKNRDRFVWELSVMKMVDHPFLSYLFYVYQDSESICLVMDYHGGGELFNRLRSCNKFSEDQTKFYAGQIALALAYLHENGIIYRDLKPENIMLDYHGNVKLIDFGFAEQVAPDKINQLTGVCGTAMYLAPELAAPDASPTSSGQGRARLYGMAVDWWAFGCVVYEMVSGDAPFGDQADLPKYEILQNITRGRVNYPRSFTKSLTKLLQGLLIYPPSKRLHWHGVQKADWFKNMDWIALINREIIPPWIPADEKPGGHKNFLKWEPKKEVKKEQGGKSESPKRSDKSDIDGSRMGIDPDLMKFDDIPSIHTIRNRYTAQSKLKASANVVSTSISMKNQQSKQSSLGGGSRKSQRVAATK